MTSKILKRVIPVILILIFLLAFIPFSHTQAAILKSPVIKTMAVAEKGIHLTWKKNIKADGYQIWRSVNGKKYKKYKTVTKSKTASFTDKKVTNGKQYQYRVKAYKKKKGKIKTSAYATSRKVRFLTKPAGLIATQNGSRVDTSWKQNGSAGQYEVSYTINGTKKTVKTQKTVFSCSIPSITKATICTIQVRTYKRDGFAVSYSPWSKTTIQIRAPGNNTTVKGFDPDTIPDYNGQTILTINGDDPFFTDTEKQYNVAKNGTFIRLSALDSLGRCGAAYACVGKETEPKDDREDISSVYPSGWKQKKLSDGTWLYNRSHLLMFALTGLNDDNRNLITGTRQFNADKKKGMYGWEMTVKTAVDRYNAHVLYRVTPVFKGDELVARGVLMEAYCIEYPEECTFCRFVYNVQDGVTINYKTGEGTETGK